MVLLQGLISYLRRAATGLVRALFGWAVRSLFGHVTKKEETLLSVVVGAAALWPLLLLGVAFPKIAAAVLAFVPLPQTTPEGAVRAVWITLAALVPVAVGLAVTRRSPVPGARGLGRLWRGFPITAGLATSFLVAFVLAPYRRLRALIAELPVPFDEWQVVYREMLQLARALHGGGSLLDVTRENTT